MREVLEHGERRLIAVSTGSLVSMEKISRRPQDLADIDALSRIGAP